MTAVIAPPLALADPRTTPEPAYVLSDPCDVGLPHVHAAPAPEPQAGLILTVYTVPAY